MLSSKMARTSLLLLAPFLFFLGRVQAFSVPPAFQSQNVLVTRHSTSIKSSETTVSAAEASNDTEQQYGQTYQTNLEIAKLASEAPRNATAAIAAHHLLNDLPNPDTVTFNGVLKAYAKSPSADGAQKAQELLEQMQDLYQQQLEANQEWYSKMKEGLNDQELSSGPPRITVKPNVRTYSTLMDAWSRRKTPQGAQDILERLLDLHKTTGDLSFQPNAIAYNTVIAAWAKGETGEDGAKYAEQLLHDMGPLADVISYNAACNAWARSGLPEAGERAEQLLRTMGDAGVRPNARTYTTVIDAWSRSHESTPESAERALNLLKEMELKYAETGDQSIRPNFISYTTTINAYALSKDPNKAAVAWELLQRMKDLNASGRNVQAKPTLITYNSVLNACATSTSWDHARLKQMVHSIYNEILDSPDLQPDHFTYGTVLKACANVFCAEQDNPEFVRQVFEQCCEDGQVSFGVCYQLRQAATSELYRSLIPENAYNPANGHFSMHDMPKEWTRNVRERRPERRRTFAR